MAIETTTTGDAPAEMLLKLWPWLEANRNKIIIAAVVIFAVIGIYYFKTSQREEREREAGTALTQLLMTPPSGMSAADALSQLATKYAGTMAAQRAELQAAATDFSMAKYADAQAKFEKFVNENSGGPLTGLAQLGDGASLEAQGKPDLAADAYQKVSQKYSGTPIAVPALCGQGRIAEAQGKLKEAADHYDLAYRAGAMGGTLAQEAGRHAAELRAQLEATSPKAVTPAATTTSSSTVTFPTTNK